MKQIYTDGPIEDEILSIIKGGKDIGEILRNDNRWPILYHLSPKRRNLLEWFEFEQDAEVLEIGAGCGAITGLLAEKVKKVHANELSPKRLEIIKNRFPKYKNIEFLEGNIEDYNFNSYFRYITLIGVLEYSGKYILNTKDPYLFLLEKCFDMLNDNGELIIAIENKLGMKYFAGAKEDHTGIYFDNIQGYIGKNGINTFSKNELTLLLRKAGFSDIDFYYPHPDYKLPHTIYSDDYLPNRNSILEAAPNYDNDRITFFEELSAFYNVCKSGDYPTFSNSFLVIAKKGEKRSKNKVIFSKFNRNRFDKYQIETKIILNNNIKRIEKIGLTDSSIDHINSIKNNYKSIETSLNKINLDITLPKMVESRDKYKVSYEFINTESANEKLINLFEIKNIEGIKNKILKIKNVFQRINTSGFKDGIIDNINLPENFYYLADKLYSEKTSGIVNLDLNFDNLYIDEDKYFFTDTEWIISNSLPINYLLYRSVYLFYNKYNFLDIESVYAQKDMYKLLEIDEMELKIYEEMENIFISQIIDKEYITAECLYQKNRIGFIELINKINTISILNYPEINIPEPPELLTNSDIIKLQIESPKPKTVLESLIESHGLIRSEKYTKQLDLTVIYSFNKHNSDYLNFFIESVRNQYLKVSQLILISPEINEVGQIEIENVGIIKYESLNELSENLDKITGNFVYFTNKSQGIQPSFASSFNEAISRNKNLKFIYADEIKNSEVFLKPDWSPETIVSYNYIKNIFVVEKNLFINIIKETIKFYHENKSNLIYDLILNSVSNLKSDEISHIPRILAGIRSSYKNRKKQKEQNCISQKNYIKKQNINATLISGNLNKWSRVKYNIENNPLVSIIILTKNKSDYLYKCIESIEKINNYSNYEIIIIDHESNETPTQLYLNQIRNKYRIIGYQGVFNFSAMNNLGAINAKGDHFLFLNNDTEITNPDSVESMLEYSQREEIGVVGAKLLYKNHTIQHSGIVLGIDMAIGHIYRTQSRDFPGDNNRLLIPSNISAVTGACMMIKREKFEELGGFDEEEFPVTFNDIDLCLKALNKGYRNIMTPYALFYHDEFGTRSKDDNPVAYERLKKEATELIKRWKKYIKRDHYLNENYTLEFENPQLFIPTVGKPYRYSDFLNNCLNEDE